MKKENKGNVEKGIAYFIGIIAIILSGMAIYTSNMYVVEENVEMEKYIYLEPEVNFVNNLTLKKDQKVKVLDLVKNSSNCVIIDKNEYVDTSEIGIKKCNLTVTDDIGIIKNIAFEVKVIE